MIDPADFRVRVIRPVLHRLRLDGRAAEDLLLGTAIIESGLRFLVQRGGGPALGIYQIEPATHRDILQWASRNLRWETALEREATQAPHDEQLVTNLAYATTIARFLYWRRPEPLPEEGDVAGYAAYWKQWFNTPLGKGTVEKFIAKAGPYLSRNPLRYG